MHGSIVSIVKKFVEVHHGAEAWSLILERGGYPGLVVSPIQTYPDKAVVELLGCACELLDCPLDDLLEEIGKFAAGELVSLVNSMLHPDWKCFEILSNVESLIHRMIRIQNPEAQPANIQAFRLNENEMQVIYSSRRGLCSLAKGILSGMGEHYRQDLEIRHTTCTKRGDPFCTFDVKIANSSDLESVKVESADGFTVLDEGDGQVNMIEATKIFDTKVMGDLKSQETLSPFQATNAGIPFPKKLGRYAISEVIGTGGMGVVYKATDDVLNRIVAIKTLKTVDIQKDLKDFFIEEARAMARLTHANVVRVYDVGLEQGRPYFVMEYLIGTPLSRRLSKGKINDLLAFKLLYQILEGLNAVHKIGLIHRDIKPANIMLSPDSQHCHVLDFGLAGAVSKNVESDRSFTSGTPGYIAPERLEGKPADYRSDYFSFGCIAFEMFCGRSPFGVGTVSSLLKSMEGFNTSINDWSDTPEDLRVMIAGLLEKDPISRNTDYSQIKKTLVTNIDQLME